MDEWCVSGFRLGKLWGYNKKDIRYIQLGSLIQCEILNVECSAIWVGMAIGVDMIAALKVLELKDSGYDIKLKCAIPCLNQFQRWSYDDQKLWHEICTRADEVVYVSTEPFTKTCMNERNIFMVDRSVGVIGVTNGAKGGTAHCLRYAASQNKEIITINPEIISPVLAKA